MNRLRVGIVTVAALACAASTAAVSASGTTETRRLPPSVSASQIRSVHASPATLHVQGVAHGVRLSLFVPRASYPANALISVTMRVDNLSRAPVNVGNNSNGDCQNYSPHALVQDAGGATLYPPAIPPGAIHSCPLAGGFRTLPPGKSVTAQQFVVLRGDRLRARVFLPIRGETESVTTSALTLHLLPSHAPTVHFHGGRNPSAEIVRPHGAVGPLYVVNNWFCTGPGGPAFSAADQTTQEWVHSASTRVVAGEPDCRRVTWWRVVAGWLGDPVATIHYEKRPGFPSQGVISAAAPERAPKIALTVPGTVETETSVSFEVRSSPRTLVTLRTSFAGQISTQTHRTGAHGRAAFSYVTPFTQEAAALRVTASTVIAGRQLSATKIVQVVPFVPVVGVGPLQVLVETDSGWAPAIVVHRGDRVRVTASYGVTEPAGSFFPPCVTGTLQFRQAGAVVSSTPVLCPTPQPTNALPSVYADVTITDAFSAGPVEAELDLAYDSGRYGIARGSRSISLSVVVPPSLRTAAQAAASPATQRYTLCAPSAIDASTYARIATALHIRLGAYRGVASVRVQRASSRCVTVTLTARGSQRTAVIAAGRPGSIVVVNGDRDPLSAGTRVRLVCSSPGCAPGVRVGTAHPTASPPILSIVLASREFKQGSAALQFGSAGDPEVVFSLTRRGSSVWCSFTGTHVQRYVASVLDGRVISDPTIEEAICAGQTLVTGLPSTARAYEIAGDLNSGPLPAALTLHP